ncbi:hypothetical protein IT575_01250 [bacterium]|nr:hypothetical protein [bacterium]
MKVLGQSCFFPARWPALVLAVLTLLCGLLLGGCPAREARPVARSRAEGELATQFSPVATQRQLGSAYARLGGARAVERLYADEARSAVLLQMRGGKGLWLDLARAAQPTELVLDRELLHVDMERRRAYALGSLQPGEFSIFQRSLPDGDWQLLLSHDKDLVRGQVLGLYSHPRWEGLVLLLRTNFSPAGSDPAAPSPAPGQVRLWDLAYDIDSAGRSGLRWQKTLELPADDLLAAPSAALLSDGLLAYSAPDGAEIELVPFKAGQQISRFPLAAGRRARLFADSSEAVAWAYLVPENSGAGTGRSEDSVQVGMLLAFGAQGELERMACGQVPMAMVAGDWASRRAALCQPAVGVAIADFARHELRWPLRWSDSRQLYLAGNGSRVLNVLPSAIVGIGVEDLAGLQNALAAAQVLPRKELRQLRPVAESLGWDWGRTQISPLLASTGRLSMFDGSDVAASLAELDWDRERGRVQSLLLTRVPGVEDEALLKLDSAALDARLRELLEQMGWPRAQAQADSGFSGPGELQAVYLLEPELAVTPGPGADALIPVSPGEFSVWITSDAAFWSLEAAGERMPAGSLSSWGIREKAWQAAAALAAAEGLQGPRLRVSYALAGGWFTADAELPLAEQALELESSAGKDSRAAVEVEVLASDAEADRIYHLLLDPLSGEVLQSGARDAGALALAQAGVNFGPADEFAPASGSAVPAEDSH